MGCSKETIVRSGTFPTPKLSPDKVNCLLGRSPCGFGTEEGSCASLEAKC